MQEHLPLGRCKQIACRLFYEVNILGATSWNEYFSSLLEHHIAMQRAGRSDPYPSFFVELGGGTTVAAEALTL